MLNPTYTGQSTHAAMPPLAGSALAVSDDYYDAPQLRVGSSNDTFDAYDLGAPSGDYHDNGGTTAATNTAATGGSRKRDGFGDNDDEEI